ncbi:hypothetical protein PR048_010323 [Dryococelus australis]|uniref:Uncharacterized protein n=1 Tax=Dryococelus australis TaxID=614101 RepID=A0ABQ9I3I1_9NEOP|nr:hypothetical protein PR048_010323 [Dryococelus australis]
MIPYSRFNKGYKNMLTIIDSYKKFTWARPVKSKNAHDVTEAMSDVLHEGLIPTNLQSDQGFKVNERHGYRVKVTGQGRGHLGPYGATIMSDSEANTPTRARKPHAALIRLLLCVCTTRRLLQFPSTTPSRKCPLQETASVLASELNSINTLMLLASDVRRKSVIFLTLYPSLNSFRVAKPLNACSDFQRSEGVTYARLHHRGSKFGPRSDLSSTQKTVAPFEFRAGLEIELKTSRRIGDFPKELKREQKLAIHGLVVLETMTDIAAAAAAFSEREIQLSISHISEANTQLVPCRDARGIVAERTREKECTTGRKSVLTHYPPHPQTTLANQPSPPHSLHPPSKRKKELKAAHLLNWTRGLNGAGFAGGKLFPANISARLAKILSEFGHLSLPSSRCEQPPARSVSYVACSTEPREIQSQTKDEVDRLSSSAQVTNWGSGIAKKNEKLKAVHNTVSTFEINFRKKKSRPLPAYISTSAPSVIRPVKLVTIDGKQTDA